MHFRSPIDPKSPNLTKFKSGTPHVTHHTIHSHIRYEFEVLLNIKDNNDCFCFKKISKVEQNSHFLNHKNALILSNNMILHSNALKYQSFKSFH